MFKTGRRKKINDLVDSVIKRNMVSKYITLFIACLIVSFAFNIFFFNFLY